MQNQERLSSEEKKRIAKKVYDDIKRVVKPYESYDSPIDCCWDWCVLVDGEEFDQYDLE